MDQETKKKVPVIFWIVAAIALLWNFMGCFVFYMQVFNLEASLEGMSEEAKEWARAMPPWLYVVFAIALLSGVLGCVGLLLKGKWSFSLFAISLAAVLVQMSYSMIIAGGYQATGPSGLVMPGLVVVMAICMVWFSWTGIRKGWLI